MKRQEATRSTQLFALVTSWQTGVTTETILKKWTQQAGLPWDKWVEELMSAAVTEKKLQQEEVDRVTRTMICDLGEL